MPTETMAARPALATVPEARHHLHVSTGTLYALMKSGSLAYVKIGRSRRIPWAVLDQFIEESTIGQLTRLRAK